MLTSNRMELNTIIHGHNTEVMQALEEESIDLIFADPPYNLQLKNDLYRPNQTKVAGVFDKWDRFKSNEEYDHFTREWLLGCRRVLKEQGAIWVIGSYHNIYRVGAIMQDLGFWILNDILWIKTNPMPNFKGTRFNNAHEILLWAVKNPKAKYTFHYKSMKTFNDDKQMRSDWYIPICSGGERLKIHSTQKPEALLYRVIVSTSKVGDVILDPFMGSGTTGAVAKRLQRNFIGIEKEKAYIKPATERIKKVTLPHRGDVDNYAIETKPPRIPFGSLIAHSLIDIGEYLYDKNKSIMARVLANGTIQYKNSVGSIHSVSAQLLNKQSNNGWTFWHIKRDNHLIPIDDLRYKFLEI